MTYEKIAGILAGLFIATLLIIPMVFPDNSEPEINPEDSSMCYLEGRQPYCE